MIEPLANSSRSVLISLNPYSGSADREPLVRGLEKSLTASGFEVEVLTSLEQLVLRTNELKQSAALRAVVGAGGDGTLSRLVNELPADTPMAIFPLGTENLMAKFLGHTQNIGNLTQLLMDGLTVRLDLGSANGKRFLIMASCGFDADVVQRLHSKRAGHIHHWSYAKPIFESIGNYPYPVLEIWLDDLTEPIEARWAFVFNVPKYAMSLPIVADADPSDGQLDLCTFKEGNLLRGLYYLAAVITGRHRHSRESQFARFRKLRIQCKRKDQVVPYQLDGDPGGELPLEILVLPKSFRVVVAKDWISKNLK